MKTFLITKPKRLLYFYLPLLFFVSCKVMLIGAYDEVTDQGIQKVQNEISTIIVKLERNIEGNTPADNNYANFKSTYETVAGEMETLRIRCNSIPKYSIIWGQLASLKDNITNLEKLHKLGITDKQVLAIIKGNFEMQFSSIIKLQNGLKREKLKK